ncbi:TPA: hypothetical protein ACGO6P_000754 [Streptococcus suis]
MKLGLAFQLECSLQAFAVLCCAVLCCAHGILLFLGCQAFFDDVVKKLSNDFGLWYNSFEKGIERQLNPSRTVLKTVAHFNYLEIAVTSQSIDGYFFWSSSLKIL